MRLPPRFSILDPSIHRSWHGAEPHDPKYYSSSGRTSCDYNLFKQTFCTALSCATLGDADTSISVQHSVWLSYFRDSYPRSYAFSTAVRPTPHPRFCLYRNFPASISVHRTVVAMAFSLAWFTTCRLRMACSMNDNYLNDDTTFDMRKLNLSKIKLA